MGDLSIFLGTLNCSKKKSLKNKESRHTKYILCDFMYIKFKNTKSDLCL